jgi:hypothetical protein
LLEPQKDRDLVGVLLELEDVVTRIDPPAVTEELARLVDAPQRVRGPRGRQQR